MSDMSPIKELAALLAYPGPGFRDSLTRLAARLSVEEPRAAAALEPFTAFAAKSSEADLEEAFIRTFDFNPSCALELGWHLYGENYKRGEFLVELRRLMRRLGVAEGTELPDHLGSVLAVLPLLDAGEAAALVRDKILPALAKMRAAAAGNPYDGVLGTIEVCLNSNGRQGKATESKRK